MPRKKIDKSKPKPSIFSTAVGRKVVELAGQGKTDAQIAEIIGVTDTTIGNWRKKNQWLVWALKEAKQAADEHVEASLYMRACGYSHPDEKIFCDKDGRVTRVNTTKHYPPDPTAMIFWLKNRKPAEWKDRVEMIHKASHELEIDAGDGHKERYEAFGEIAGGEDQAAPETG